jgi:group I intron endonuclease
MTSEQQLGLPCGRPSSRLNQTATQPMQGIYKIIHIPSGRYYVGSAINIINRFARHNTDLNNNKHHCIYLQRLWNKHGKDKFIFEFIEEVADKVLLIQREQKYIDFAVNAGLCLNTCLTAGNCLGVKHSLETRQKRSELMKGIVFTEERKQNISKARKKQGVSEETIKRLKEESLRQAFKLTFVQAAEIWAKHCNGMSLMKIAKELGVSPKPLRRELKARLGEIYNPIKRPHSNQLKGNLHGMAILSEQDVVTIRLSTCSIKNLAIQYGVSYACVHDIVRGRSWKHLL